VHEAEIEDKRGEPRIHSEVAVFVETFCAPSGEARSPSIVISKTLDFSANGLQVIMDRPINLGSILQLCVEFTEEHERYNLVGEVRWVSRTRFEEHFLVGFMLLDAGHSRIEDWKRKLSQLIVNPRSKLH
jgi:hypothetical protein